MRRRFDQLELLARALEAHPTKTLTADACRRLLGRS
jgi:hypothetical protein